MVCWPTLLANICWPTKSANFYWSSDIGLRVGPCSGVHFEGRCEELFVGMLDCLTFLPVDDVAGGMQYLTAHMPNCDGLTNLLTYFDVETSLVFEKDFT